MVQTPYNQCPTCAGIRSRHAVSKRRENLFAWYRYGTPTRRVLASLPLTSFHARVENTKIDTGGRRGVAIRR